MKENNQEKYSDFLNIDSEDISFQSLVGDVKDLYNIVSFDLNKKASFEDFIRYLVALKSKQAIQPLYNTLAEAWKANGYPLNNVIATREAIFNDANALIEDFVNNPDFQNNKTSNNIDIPLSKTINLPKDKIRYDLYSEQWMYDICTALNNEGLKMPKSKGGGVWRMEEFENVIEFIKNYITFDRGIYDYLNSIGLLNKGRCPVTGNYIRTDYYYQLFGRVIYLSQEGKLKFLEWDKKEHIKIFGNEPLTPIEKNYLKKEAKNQTYLGCLSWLLLVVGILYMIKKCT